MDDSANVISYEEYYPFGTTSYRSGKNESEVKLKRYRYCGKERDEETGLYYYGARFYAAWIGKFISIDPLAEKFPQLTPYNYAGNKPVTYKDLHGLQSTEENQVKTGKPESVEDLENIQNKVIRKLANQYDEIKKSIGKSWNKLISSNSVNNSDNVMEVDAISGASIPTPKTNNSKEEKVSNKDQILNEMKILTDKNIAYSQQGNRTSLCEKGLSALDCSELVSVYLKKLNIMDEDKALATLYMKTEAQFRKAIGSENIDFVKNSDSSDFVPKKGDIFVWRTNKGGHTGIVYKVDGNKITILEAIGKSGSRSEDYNKQQGGETKTGVTRTAIFEASSKALAKHPGWIGYFRPVVKKK